MVTKKACCLLLVALLLNLDYMTTARAMIQDIGMQGGNQEVLAAQTTVTPEPPQPSTEACGPQFSEELQRADRFLKSMRSEDLANARAIYQGVVAKDPECVAAYEGIGSTYTLPEGAIEALSTMVEKYDKSAAAHYVLGKAYLKGRLWTDAADAFEAALELGAPGNCASFGLEVSFYNLDVLESVDVVHKSVNQLSHGSVSWNCSDLESSVAQIPGLGGKDYLSGLPPIGIIWRAASSIDGRRQDLLWALGHMYVKKAQIRSGKGSYLSALRLYQNALSVYQRLNENWKQLVAQKGTAIAGQNIGFFMVIADAVTEAEILTEISSIYLRIGDRPLSVEYIEKARTSGRTALALAGMYNQFTLFQVQPTIEYLEGVANLATQNYISATQHFETVIDNESYLGPFQVSMETLVAGVVATNQGGDWSRIKVLQDIGNAFSSVGEYQTATRYLERGLASCKTEDLPLFWQYYGYSNRLGCGMILTELGHVSSALDKLDEAKNYFNEAMNTAKQINDPTLESAAAFGLCIVEERQGNAETALEHCLLAVELRERVANQLPIESLRAQFESGTAEIYEHVIPLLLLLDKPELAFTYAERARARAFLDQLGNRRVNPKGNEDAHLIQQETELQNEIADLELQRERELGKPQSQRNQQVIDQVTTSLDARHQEYSKLLTELQVANPEYADLVTVSPLNLTEAQTLLRDRAPDVTLITYFVSENNTTIFVIGPQTFYAQTIPVTRQELYKQTGLLLQQMRAQPLLPQAWQEPAQALYEWLVTPIQKYLPAAVSNTPASLYIIPHDLLNYLPFDLLFDRGNVLSDNYALSFAPSVSSLRFIFDKRHSQASTILAMANPDAPGVPHLHYAVEETKEIAALYNSEPLIGQDATEKTFKDKASMYSLIHIAAHSDYNPENPLFSAILLQPGENEDGRLETREVMNLNLPETDLVILSACETHLGALSKGDELVGLERAFIRAGTPSLLTTLWSVDDAATKILMKQFYTHLQAGVPKAKALNLAQKETRVKYPNPYYWAGFVLVGDGGQSGVPLPQNINSWPLLTAAMLILVVLSGLGILVVIIRCKRNAKGHMLWRVALGCSIVALAIVVAAILLWNQSRQWAAGISPNESTVKITSTLTMSGQPTTEVRRNTSLQATSLAPSLFSTLSANKEMFVGEFDAKRALELMYGSEGRIYTGSEGQLYVQTRITSTYSSESSSWYSIEPTTATVKVLLVVPFQQEQVDKYILLTEATYSEIPCHYCLAIIGGAIFSRNGDAWQMEVGQKYITGLGAWESAPRGELIRIGPDRYGILFRDKDGMQGIIMQRVVLVTVIEKNFLVILNADTDGDNLGACRTIEGGKCWQYSSKTEFIPGKNPSYYDFRITINGTKAADNEIYSPQVIPFNEVQLYTFTGLKYELSTTSK